MQCLGPSQTNVLEITIVLNGSESGLKYLSFEVGECELSQASCIEVQLMEYKLTID